MAHISDFSAAAALARRRPRHTKRDIADKLTEIYLRSPKDAAAFDQLADLVLARLDADEESARFH